MTGVASAGHDVLGGIGVDADNAAGPSQKQQSEALPGPPPRLTAAEREQQLKQQEKAAKKARRELKKVCCTWRDDCFSFVQINCNNVQVKITASCMCCVLQCIINVACMQIVGNGLQLL